MGTGAATKRAGVQPHSRGTGCSGEKLEADEVSTHRARSWSERLNSTWKSGGKLTCAELNNIGENQGLWAGLREGGKGGILAGRCMGTVSAKKKRC